MFSINSLHLMVQRSIKIEKCIKSNYVYAAIRYKENACKTLIKKHKTPYKICL